ncbi:MAG TPA: A24 family peptidase [Allosphingosinicella sp.]|nr:A24 family peptidase [Allosphingosinicella sp.]
MIGYAASLPLGDPPAAAHDLVSGGATAFGFVLGAVIGSFLAAILIRWPEGRSVMRGRSACDGCGRTLRAAELVPILSWFAVRGRCRTCGAAINKRHLAVEAGAALIGLTAVLAHPLPAAAFTAILGWWLFLLAALDVEHQWLPDRLTLPLIPAGLAVAWAGVGPGLEERLFGAAAGYLSLELIRQVYRLARGREGLGGGDPKLFAAIGAWLGWASLPFVMLGAGLLGLAAVTAMRLRGKQVSATDRLPLGTLLALGAWPLWLLLAR